MRTSHLYISLSSMRPAENPSTGFLCNSKQKKFINIGNLQVSRLTSTRSLFFETDIMSKRLNVSSRQMGEVFKTKKIKNKKYRRVFDKNQNTWQESSLPKLRRPEHVCVQIDRRSIGETRPRHLYTTATHQSTVFSVKASTVVLTLKLIRFLGAEIPVRVRVRNVVRRPDVTISRVGAAENKNYSEYEVVTVLPSTRATGINITKLSF